jgi:hypothetical protein
MPPLLQNTAQLKNSRKMKASALAAFLGVWGLVVFESDAL